MSIGIGGCLREGMGEIVAPSLFVTGWWDCTVHHMFDAYLNWRTRAVSVEARELSKLMVGPWTHTRLGVGDFGADLSFPDADRHIGDLHLWWYDPAAAGYRYRCR